MDTDLEAVAMSGGVDSSVAALLRQREGHSVIGLTMKLWDSECDGPSADRACCTADHAADARRVCQKLQAPHYTLDLREEFQRHVVDVFVSEYLKGRTPNPCVRCNTYMKWDVLWERAAELGCSRLVTGHYARIVTSTDGPGLFRAADPAKDQSYFLWGIPRHLLGRTSFPLADLPKLDTRRLAEEAGLPTARKKESQDICFVPGGDYRALVRSRGVGSPLLEPGPIAAPDGATSARHEGLASYTIGQRRGVKVAWREPLYVTGIDVPSNTLHLGPRSDLDVDILEIEEQNWLVDRPETIPDLAVQVRYRSSPVPCQLERGDSSSRLRLARLVSSPAAGQSMVLYRGEQVVGGGVLGSSSRAH